VRVSENKRSALFVNRMTHHSLLIKYVTDLALLFVCPLQNRPESRLDIRI